MMTLFIADLHLSNEEPAICAGFFSFLQQEAIHADALYILGDLFEVWIGDDDPNPLHQDVAKALSHVAQHGVAIYFIHGNRDFLLDTHYAKQCGMTLLPSEAVIDLYGKPVLILHGDTLCTDDIAYQRYRKRIHNRYLRYLFLRLPLWIRLRIANQLRKKSQRANAVKALTIMDVNQNAVLSHLKQYHTEIMIHGHTHRGAIHTLSATDKVCHRIVLDAWHQQGSVVRFYPDGHFQLASIPFPETAPLSHQ